MNVVSSFKPIHPAKEKSPVFMGLFDSLALQALPNITRSDKFTLLWFVEFAMSGRMMYEERDGRKAFWVQYDFAAGRLDLSVNGLQASFARLSATSDHPLERVVEKAREKTRVFFLPRADVMFKILAWDSISDDYIDSAKEMLSMNSASLFEPEDVPTSADNRKEKRIHPHIVDFLKDFCAIKMANGERLFNTTPPEDEHHYTKLVYGFSQMLWDIYEGTFLKHNQVTDEFRGWYPALFDGAKPEALLRSLKSSWPSIFKTLKRAAENYAEWFLPNNEPLNKEGLPRSIDKWAYNAYSANGASLMLACLVRGPYPVSDAIADSIYDKLPDPIREIAETLNQESFNQPKFWGKVREVFEWGSLARPAFRKMKVQNLDWWFDNLGVVGWFGHYVKWLKDKVGGGGKIALANLGVDNPTWAWWIKDMAKTHNLTPISALEMSLEELRDQA